MIWNEDEGLKAVETKQIKAHQRTKQAINGRAYSQLKIKAFTLIGIEFYSQYLKQYLKKNTISTRASFCTSLLWNPGMT